MNLINMHSNDKGVSAKSISGAFNSKVLSIQILSKELLKEHITKTPAILICVLGEVEYNDEKGNKTQLKPGDFKEIEPMVKHWVKGILDSQLILVK